MFAFKNSINRNLVGSLAQKKGQGALLALQKACGSTTEREKSSRYKSIPVVKFQIVDLDNKYYDVSAWEGETLMNAGIQAGVPFEVA
mmetsp:Transcript_4993/g.4782  ORF Transcript_4993/g.4782 Transcript_4993/m.4782 type:complete len:87 (-) Transcript_4993:99-359(-)